MQPDEQNQLYETALSLLKKIRDEAGKQPACILSALAWDLEEPRGTADVHFLPVPELHQPQPCGRPYTITPTGEDPSIHEPANA
jgi:hypothetical protein